MNRLTKSYSTKNSFFKENITSEHSHSKRKEDAKGEGSVGKEHEEFYQTKQRNLQGTEGIEADILNINTKNEQNGLVKFKS